MSDEQNSHGEVLKLRCVALLDVDHTLIFHDNTLNKALIDCLKQNFIKDVYLFTDMTFHDSGIQDREQLLENLKKQELNVVKVLTPNDICWEGVNSEEALTLHKWCFEERKYNSKLFGEEFESYVTSNAAELPTLAAAISNYIPEKTPLGKGYEDAQKEFNASNTLSDPTKARSIFAKCFGDHLSAKKGYHHNKGLLLDMFLAHKPEWVGSVIVADDNEKVIKDVSDFRRVSGDRAGIPVTMIPVREECVDPEYYKAQVDEHWAKVPVEQRPRPKAPVSRSWSWRSSSSAQSPRGGGAEPVENAGGGGGGPGAQPGLKAQV